MSSRVHQFAGYAAGHDVYVLRLLQMYEQRGCTVENKLKDMDAQRAGIDLVINGKTVDVKADSQVAKSGNIAFELVSNFEHGTVGVGLKGTQWWAYIDTENETMYLLSLRALRELIAGSERRDFKMIWPSTETNDGNTYHTFALLVPLQWVLDNLTPKECFTVKLRQTAA